MHDDPRFHALLETDRRGRLLAKGRDHPGFLPQPAEPEVPGGLNGASKAYVMTGRRTPEGQLLETDEQVAAYLLDSVGVAVVHGAAFGLSPAFRISNATDTATLEDACQRIQKACAALC
jgi:hypothetical protein